MKISLLATGGTISNKKGNQGFTPQLSAASLLNQYSISSDEIDVHTRDILRVSSRNITPDHIWQLSQAIKEEIKRGAEGIVITHGTDSLEETAYGLSLLCAPVVPIVLTGAMRVPGSPGEDGPANILTAITVASTKQFSMYGPVVVHQDEIHLAKWVTKLHSTRVAAFGSPASGAVGVVVEGKAIPLHGPLPPANLANTKPPNKRVELITAVTGSDGLLVSLIKNQTDGIVVAAMGGGHVSSALAEELIKAAKEGIDIVISSRCPSAQMLSRTYGGIGSETNLIRDSGLYSAGSLSPLKARLKLLFGLSSGYSAEQLFITDNSN